MRAITASEVMSLLAKTTDGGGFSACTLEIAAREAVTADELPELMRGGRGLLVYTGEIMELRGELVKTDRLLSAEVAFPGEERSVHVQWDGGAYRVTTYMEKRGETHLRYDESHISAQPGITRVRYAVYLEPRAEGGAPAEGVPEVGVWRPVAARFLGFDDAGEE